MCTARADRRPVAVVSSHHRARARVRATDPRAKADPRCDPRAGTHTVWDQLRAANPDFFEEHEAERAQGFFFDVRSRKRKNRVYAMRPFVDVGARPGGREGGDRRGRGGTRKRPCPS